MLYPRSSITTCDPAFIPFPAQGPLTADNLPNTHYKCQWFLYRQYLPAIHFHDLRHTGNTLTAEAGASLRELMEGVGHSSTRAAVIFLHSTSERQRVLADTLGALVAAKLKSERAYSKASGKKWHATVLRTPK